MGKITPKAYYGQILPKIRPYVSVEAAIHLHIYSMQIQPIYGYWFIHWCSQKNVRVVTSIDKLLFEAQYVRTNNECSVFPIIFTNSH